MGSPLDNDLLLQQFDNMFADDDLDDIKLTGTTGHGLLDFIGQGVWGASEALTWNIPGAVDVAGEAMDPEFVTLEERMLGGIGLEKAAGDWEELSNWGKAGYATGQFLGSLPWLGTSALLGKGGVTAFSRMTGLGTKLATHKASQELIEWGVKEGTKKAPKVVKSLNISDDSAKEIIKEGLEVQKAGKDFLKLTDELTEDIVTKITAKDLKSTIVNVLKITDDEAVEVSEQVMKIIMKNNPDDAFNFIQMAIQQTPLVNKALGGEGTSRIIAAMGVDAAIGLAMGTQRALANQIVKYNMGVNTDHHTGQRYYNPDYIGGYNFWDGASNWWSEASTTAWHFSLIGPVKYWKGFGGTTGSHGRRFMSLFSERFKSLKPIKKMGNQELRANIEGINQISGGYLLRTLPDKITKKYPSENQFWLEMKNPKNKAEMKILRDFLRDTRKTFLRNAPWEWAKEFGKDAFLSIPRMGAGVMAMHAPSMISNFSNYGFSKESFVNSFGMSPEERYANILMAAYFTRRPHSFNTEATGPTFNKFFNTGKLPAYFNAKTSKLRKIMGGLKLYGVETKNMDKIIRAYGSEGDFSMPNINDAVDKSIKNWINETKEFSTIKEILLDYTNSKNKPGGTLLEDAFTEKIIGMLESGEITVAQSRELYDRLFIAQKVLELYRTNAKDESIGDTYFPDQAYEIVNKLSTIKLNERVLTTKNIDPELEIFKETAVNNSILPPTKILKNFIIETYRALGFDIGDPDPRTGKIIIPKIPKKLSDKDLEIALKTVIDRGIKNNWVEERAPLSSETMHFKAEHIHNAKKVMELAIERMHTHTYGSNWKNNVEVDPLILENLAWHLPYYDLQFLRRNINVYNILRGDTNHTLDPGNVKVLQDTIVRFFTSKEAPNLRDVGELGTVEAAQLKEFIQNFHNIIVKLNPGSLDRRRENMSYEEASALKDLVEGKAQKGGLFGDVFTNKEQLLNLEKYIMSKSLRELNGYGFKEGIDIKASILTMITDKNLNVSEDVMPVLPEYGLVHNILLAAKMNNEINRKTYEMLRDHYKLVTEAIDNSSFPVRFSDNVAQFNSAGWIQSLKYSVFKGTAALDTFSLDGAHQMSGFLTNEIQRQEMYIKGLRIGQGQLNDKAQQKVNAELNKLVDILNETSRLKDYIKESIDMKNTYQLSAIFRHQGKIEEIINLLRTNPIQSTRDQYLIEIVEVINKIKATAQQRALNDTSIQDKIRQDIASYSKDLPEKDVQSHIIKISQSQFAAKYGISSTELDKIFVIDKMAKADKLDVEIFIRNIVGDFYENTGNLSTARDVAQLNNIIRTLEGFKDNINFNVNNPEGLKNFRELIVKPLEIMMRESVSKMEKSDRPSETDMATDLYAVTSNYFTKRVVKTLRVDAREGLEALEQGEKVIGNAVDRGFGAILEALDPDQTNIYLADRKGTDVNGNLIRDITADQLKELNVLLDSGKFHIFNPKGQSDFYNTGSKDQINNVNRNKALINERYQIIPINEKVSLIVRMDNHETSIHKQIRAQFRSPNPVLKDKGGNLYRFLEAIYDGDLSLDTPQHKAMRNYLKEIQSASSDNAVIQAIKLTRMMYNMPAFISRVLSGNNIDLNHSFILDINKRDNLTEAKNGYIPTKENRLLTADIYKNSSSDLHQKVYNETKGWLENPNKKLKLISINDEGKIVDNAGRPVLDKNGEPLVNIFDSAARLKSDIEKAINDGEFTRKEGDALIESFDKDFKSLVDGQFFLHRTPYLAFMGMIGIHGDMVRTNSYGDIIGFKSGAIKPTISHSSVDLKTGRIEQFFAKTSFQHSPFLDLLMETMGIDGITFKSASKINTLKEGFLKENNEMYSTLEGVSQDVLNQSGTRYSTVKDWSQYISLTTAKGTQIKNMKDLKIIEVPLESLSLRTVSREHDPLVGQNAGVHMSHDNGIASWIGLENKLESYHSNLNRQYTNISHRTALAQQIFGERAKDGDPAAVNSAISSILTRDGLIIEPWAQRRLEDNMIGYFLNNGGVAGGVVEHGSLDVMQADFGTLKPTLRSTLGNRKTVRYFGEFLPSYYGASKPFITYDRAGRDGPHSFLIQRINYVPFELSGYSAPGTRSKDVSRLADAFIVEIGGEKFLQVEGMYIGKDGKLRDPRNPELPIIQNKNFIDYNKKAYEKALKLEADVYKEIDMLPSPTIASVADITKNFKGVSVGAINSRQPRNMMGDLVISRVGYDTQGNPYTPIESGNVSRMNYIDAIKPQDADFDMDKSFYYSAAPGKFLRETNSLAGDIVTGSAATNFNKLFDPNMAINPYAKQISDMLGPESTYYEIQRQVDMQRGRFIKMHQTATYIANIFRSDPTILRFKFKDVGSDRRTMEVRLSDYGDRITTVENISRLASEFIDIYKNLPSSYREKEIFDLQNQIWFGENGIFQIGYTDVKAQGVTKWVSKSDMNLNQSVFAKERKAIIQRLIRPINEYLKYNKGYITEPSGIQQKARLYDYNEAYIKLVENTLNIYSDFALPEGAEFTGLTTAAKYFTQVSVNPYDIAMRELHSIYTNTTNIKATGRLGRQRNESQDLIDYIERGYDGVIGDNMQIKYKKVFNQALAEYVKDESRMLRLHDLVKREESLKLKISEEKKYLKKGQDVSENEKLNRLQSQLRRVQEVKSSMEEALSYKFRNNIDATPYLLPVSGKYHRIGDFYNGYDKPVVVVDAKDNIKMVIQSRNSNNLEIKPGDKIILNGKRFKMADGLNQEGLRVLFQAFSGLPRIRVGSGRNAKYESLTDYEVQAYVIPAYKELQAKLISLKENSRNKTQQDKADLRLRTEQLLADFIFDPIFSTFRDNPHYRKALILRMLTPNISDKEVSVRPTNRTMGKSAVYDYIYMENSLSEPIISLLAKISSGEKAGYDKDLATEILNDINILKNAAYIASKNPNIDIELQRVSMYTEPASLEGSFTSQKHLNQSIFELQNSRDRNVAKAAKIMVDYAQGKGLIDPVVLYKASRVMAEKGIPFDQQWGRVKFLEKDGQLVKFGFDRIFIPEFEALTTPKVGERGGVMESARDRIQQDFDCYLK